VREEEGTQGEAPVSTPRLRRVLAAALLLTAAGGGTAHADLRVVAFDGAISADAGGASSVQAGGHPYAMITTFEVNAITDTQGNVMPADDGPKDFEVTLPAGLMGNPAATPLCSMEDFLAPPPFFRCPPGSQVGLIDLKLGFGNTTDASTRLPLYNLDPSPRSIALFGARFLAVPIFLELGLNTDNYRVTAMSRNSSQGLSVLGASITLWGVPAETSHDPDRTCKDTIAKGCSTEAPRKPLLTNPTFCVGGGEGLRTDLRVNSWANPGVFSTASYVSHSPPGYSLETPLAPDRWGQAFGMQGCEDVPFDPSISVTADSSAPDSPTGLAIDLTFPQG
jgi:hypothetical protein